MITRKNVCVIGAGASGLVAIKELVEMGHSVVCYEKTDKLGGIFVERFTEDRKWKDLQHGNSVYPDLHLTVSLHRMAFSDFPPGSVQRVHPTSADYCQYLRDYCQHFSLLPFIKYNHKIINVSRFYDSGEVRWRILIDSENSPQPVERIFDCVAICTGTHQELHAPAVPAELKTLWDEERKKYDLHQIFPSIIHSSQYVDNEPFRHKRVLFFGCGESAADVVANISSVASHSHMTARRFPYVIPRTVLDASSDEFDVRQLYHDEKLTSKAKRFRSAFVYMLILIFYLLTIIVQKICGVKAVKFTHNSFGEEMAGEQYIDYKTKDTAEIRNLMNAWMIEEDSSAHNKFATKNCRFVDSIVSGKVKFIKARYSKIKKIVDKGNVVYAVQYDGYEREYIFDKIVLCTGFRDKFSFLDATDQDLQIEDDNVRNLFRNIFNPKIGSSLAFIGWVRPSTGGIPAASELAARYFSLLCANKAQLPVNYAEIAKEEKRKLEEQFVLSPEINTVTAFVEWADKMAELIACKPNFKKYIFRPSIFFRLLFAPTDGFQYRLTGPGAKEDVALSVIKKYRFNRPFIFGLIAYRILYGLGLTKSPLVQIMRRLEFKNNKADVEKVLKKYCTP